MPSFKPCQPLKHCPIPDNRSCRGLLARSRRVRGKSCSDRKGQGPNAPFNVGTGGTDHSCNLARVDVVELRQGTSSTHMFPTHLPIPFPLAVPRLLAPHFEFEGAPTVLPLAARRWHRLLWRAHMLPCSLLCCFHSSVSSATRPTLQGETLSRSAYIRSLSQRTTSH